MVKQQVESQIKVRDLSRTAVTISPAEYGSWHEARSDLMSEAKVRSSQSKCVCGTSETLSACSQAGLKARLETELAAAADDDALNALREKFSEQERQLEHSIGASCHRRLFSLGTHQPSPVSQTTPCTPSRARSISTTTRVYASNHPLTRALAHSCPSPCAVPLQVERSVA